MPINLLLALLALLGPVSVLAAESDPYAADRQALIKLFREMEASINAQDVERMVAQMHPAGDGDLAERRGLARTRRDQGLLSADGQGRAAHPRPLPDRPPSWAPRTFLRHGEVAVADGTMVDEFFPVARGPFTPKFQLDLDLGEDRRTVESGVDAPVVERVHQFAARRSESGHLVRGGGRRLLGLVLGWLLGRMRRR
jgi:hypothetical protein